MIAYLSGKILSKSASSLILQTQGVGYKVFMPTPVLLKVRTGQEVSVYVHTYVREDQISLYGFLTEEELELFELFISVSGIGPKMAISILSSTSVVHIKSAIASGESVIFTKVSGVGRKTADRIIVELKEKIGEEATAAGIKSTKELSESLDALVALGYSKQEAREALKQVPPGITGSGSIIKEALRILGKR